MKYSSLTLLCTGLLAVTVSCSTSTDNLTGNLLSTPAQKNGSVHANAIENKGPSPYGKALTFYESAMSLCADREYDAALEALDQAYNLILEVEPKTAADFRHRDDLRLTIAKQILTINSSRTKGLHGTQSPIQIPVDNPYVKAEIARLTGPEREFFKNSYRRSGMYTPYILKRLREQGLPEELAWIPLIESGYQVRALSPARALGLWQFIPSTGIHFGLKREFYVDERMDPEKSTNAAIAYLMELHDLFGDWPTVLAAYNCGEGRVRNTIRDQHVNYLDNFWDLYARLPQETARYVPRFLATLHIVNNMEKYGFDPNDIASPIPHEKIRVQRNVSLEDIAATANIPLEDLKTLNPALRYGTLPKEAYVLKIPPGHSKTVLASIGSIAEAKPPQRKTRQYHAAKRSGTLSASTPARISPKVAQNRQTLTYSVKKGDTLSGLADRFNTNIKSIMAQNRLSNQKIRTGQKLRIPGTGQRIKAASPNRGRSTYVVQAGDVPGSIAEKHNIPLARFLSINNLSKKSTIHPGQKVYIK